MKRTLLYILLFSSFLSLDASACLNEYGVNIFGTPAQTAMELLTNPYNPRDSKMTEKLKQGKKMLQEKAASGTYKDSSDLASVLLRLGETEAAMKMLRKLAKEHPLEYNVAANLGTGYELSGKNDSAYYWIEKAMHINPDSHFGSEWIHLKILKAKMALAQDKMWLHNNSILGITSGTAIIPRIQGLPRGKREYHLIRELGYQLHERTFFIPPADPIVADLMALLADAYALNVDAAKAADIYKLSLEYGPTNRELVLQRHQLAEAKAKINEKRFGDPKKMPVDTTPVTEFVNEKKERTVSDADTSLLKSMDSAASLADTALMTADTLISKTPGDSGQQGSIKFFRNFFLAFLIVTTLGFAVVFLMRRKKS